LVIAIRLSRLKTAAKSLVIHAVEMTKCITFLNAPCVVIYGNVNSIFQSLEKLSLPGKMFYAKKGTFDKIAVYAGFLSWTVRYFGFTTLAAFDISPAAN
jgi:hypothetical protein